MKKIFKGLALVAGYVHIIDTVKVIYDTGFAGFKELAVRSFKAGKEYWDSKL